MNWKTRIRAALPGSIDDDVIDELSQHSRAMYDSARAEGCTHEEAERRVARLIAEWRENAPVLRHKSRRVAPVEPPAGSSSLFAGVGQDARYAIRLLVRQPRFALLVILTMALGIGSTTTLFSVTYGVLMKPLPWADADRLVVLTETRGGRAPRFGSFSNAAYLAWREQATTIEDIGAWSWRTATITGAGDPERIRIANVSASLFRAIRARPLMGSLFTEAQESEKVVVLGEGLWRQRFGADPAVVGRSLRFDGDPYTVIGVLPDAQSFPDRQSRAWFPYRVEPAAGNFLSMFEAIGKLRPGITPEQAAAEGTGRGRFAPDSGLTTNAIFGGGGPVEVSARPLREALTGEVRRPLLVLLGAVTLLLLTAMTNVASLQLARTTGRQRELAIRAAVGASGSRVLRQLVIESVAVGALGGTGGVMLAAALHRGLSAILPADFPRVTDFGVDTTVILFAVVVTIIASIAVGLAPALRVRRLNLVESLAEDGGAPVGAGRRTGVARTRLAIIGGQVAVACVLLVGAPLLARSFLRLLHEDRGYDADRVLITALPMTAPGDTPHRRIALLEESITRIQRIPGVQQAAFTSEAPVTPGGSTSSFRMPSRDAAAGDVTVQASPRIVSPSYFQALGLRVITGRALAESDVLTSQPVVVVNETFARRYLGNQPLSATIPKGVWGRVKGDDVAVVGVVEDVRYVGRTVSTLPELYYSYRQLTGGLRSSTGTILVRVAGDASAVAGAVRQAVRQVDTALVPGSVMLIQDRLLVTSLARPRLYAVLLGVFATVAMLVTGVGLLGVLSFTVAQRTRELGVRAALGARRSDLVLLVLRQGLGIALVGALGGLVLAAWLARFLSTLLYGITTRDPLTYLAVPVIVLVVSAIACLAPSIRAARLDPLRALRG